MADGTSTLAVASENTSVALAVTPESVEYGLLVKQVPDGTDANGVAKVKTVLRAISRESEMIAAKKEAEENPNTTQFATQSFSFDKAGTVDGILQVIKDPEEAVAIFNAGLKVRFNTKVVAKLTSTDDDGNPDFVFQPGNVDMRADLNEPSQKRNLTPMQKATKTLTALPGVTPEKLAQIMALLAAQ